jgi:hypothetical protein
MYAAHGERHAGEIESMLTQRDHGIGRFGSAMPVAAGC